MGGVADDARARPRRGGSRATTAAGRKRAERGSARRSSVRSVRAAACFTSTRLEATPMSRLARAPERSSPCQVGSPSVGALARYSGSEVMVEVEVVLEFVGLGHHPAQPRLWRLVVGAVHEQERAAGSRKRPDLLARGRAGAGRAPWRRRGGRRRCRNRRRGTRPAPSIRRAPPTRTRCGRPPTARPATPRRARTRPGGGSGASGRCGRTCRAGSRPPSTPPKAAARRMPGCRSRMIVSPETRNSSMRMYQGPTVSRPAAAKRPQALFVLGPDGQVVVDHGHLPVEQELGEGRVAPRAGRAGRR